MTESTQDTGQLDLPWEQDEPTRARHSAEGRQERRRRRQRRRRTGRSYGALAIAAVLLLVLGVGVYWGVGELQQNQRIKEFLAADYAAADMGDDVPFAVEAGAGGTAIAAGLLDAGVIESRTAFVRLCESREPECLAIQPGVYLLQLRSPAETVFEILVDPGNKISDFTTSFTIREGLTVIQTLAELARQTGKPLEEFQAAAEDLAGLGIEPEWYRRSDGRPSAAATRDSVEGFLFPDTYYYDPAATARDILKRMVDEFFVVADEVGLRTRAAALDLSPYEVLITASLVQAEGLEPDFSKVARVAYNRAYEGMIECRCLQFDSTAHYWLEVQEGAPRTPGSLSQDQLNDPDNPYNTYAATPGMPIGPIGNPGEAALRAAANPEAGDWIYFTVIEPDGTTAFSSTWAQFCADKFTGVRNGVDLYTDDC
jgi:UPF0755 protein